ncbi:MAG: DNA polymerase III subunit delta [Alphaproteobacteria bacterium]|nr:DNA polymerase III subunit delta [Alphaproteobacteria bacterium]MDP6517480.1 DNA polymerase III subunit delta [Alphaproteobacteria bacterium]
MKITARNAEHFIDRPDPGLRAALVYGPDRGMVTERARRLARSRVADLDDPFRVSELTWATIDADPARLIDEAAALSLTGGARVVRVRDAANDLAPHFAALLEAAVEGMALVVAEAGDLGRGAALRKLFEAADNGAAIACYGDDEGSLEALIRGTLDQAGLNANHGALAYLKANLGSDRLVTRAELDKLVLYMRGQDRLDEADAAACIGDSADITRDDLAFAATAGDHLGAGRALTRLGGAGTTPVSVLGALARHLQRLHLVRGRIGQGARLEEAIAALRPPVFFKRAPAFRAHAQSWSTARLAAAMDLLVQAEIDCKTTGMPAALIASLAVMRITEAGRRQRPGH